MWFSFFGVPSHSPRWCVACLHSGQATGWDASAAPPSAEMNLVYGSFCPLHEGNARCPCRTLTTNASIWTAAELGDVERVRVVMTVKGRRPDSLDPHGYTPLHLAAQNGRLGVVQYLLEAGANPDGVPAEAGGCGATPLHRAAFAGQLPCVRALLAAGASASAVDASFLDMKTPLHKAAGQGHRGVCIALMEAGADPNTPDAAGNSVLDVLNLSSSPALPDAALISASTKQGGGGGGGGGGTEACSTVVLSSGEGQDWNGVREALERNGGCRKLGESPGARDDGDRGCDGDGGGDGQDSRVRRIPAAGSGDGLEEAGPERESARAPPPLASASKEAAETDAGVGGEGPEEAMAEPTSCGAPPCGRLREVDAAAAPAPPVASKGELADTPRSDHVGNMSVGIPCGECLLPKMVMVRASCCGSLLCKPCVRELCARRHSCRRCRDSSGD